LATGGLGCGLGCAITGVINGLLLDGLLLDELLIGLLLDEAGSEEEVDELLDDSSIINDVFTRLGFAILVDI
jgi:hypothetical protein